VDSGQGIPNVLWGTMIFVTVMVAGLIAWSILRNRFFGRQGSGHATPFSHDHLQQMLDQGLINKEEFDKIKYKLLGQTNMPDSNDDNKLNL